MNILVVTSFHPKDASGGAEIQAHLISSGLKDLGQRVIFCSVLSNYEIETKEPDGIDYISFKRRRNVAKRIIKFHKLLKKLQPDVVYVRCFYSFWWINIVCKLLRIPNLYHVSSITDCIYLKWKHYVEWKREKHPLKFLKKMILHNFFTFNIRFADIIVCQTEEQRKILKNKIKKEISLVRNGHPLPSALPLKYDKEFNVVWIGKYWKNPEIFIDLVKRFRDKSEMFFWMIGVFPEKDNKLYKQIDEGLSNFKFVGELSNGEINSFLEKSHVLVNTSEYEGFSNTYIQAWLRGIPVLSLKVNPDGLLTDEKIGFHSKTLDQLTDDLMKLYDDRDLYNEYSKNCFNYAYKEHDIRNTSEQIWNLSRKIMKKNG